MLANILRFRFLLRFIYSLRFNSVLPSFSDVYFELPDSTPIFHPFALKKAKTSEFFGRFERKRVKTVI